MIRVRAATLRDVDFILEDPSSITARELEASGVTTWQALQMFHASIQKGFGRTLTRDGVPLFVLALRPSGEGLQTCFVASEAYWRLGASGVRLGRALVASIAEKFPGRALVARTWSAQPQVARWFALLGFEKQCHLGLSTVFVRPPKAEFWGDSRRGSS
jgi:hypothetical protein